MMKKFKVMYTGDYLDERGLPAHADLFVNLYENIPFIEYGFLEDQKPSRGDRDYWKRLYSLEIEPRHIAGANGLVIFRPWVKASAFSEGAANLVVIGRAGAGYDKIDLEACTANDVAVFNAPDTLTHATASAALLLMLALAKRLPDQERLVRTNRWDLQPRVMGDDLPGKTLGIVGLGASGSELARLVAPFGMRVIAYSPRATSAQAEAVRAIRVDSLDQLLSESDFVSLHCKLEKHTRGMIGEREFHLMKNAAYFINVGRGELVDQDALVCCLREHRIAGAGLDVFEFEPLPEGDPLLELDNVILTPHWLTSTRQAARSTMDRMTQGMIRAARGELPNDVINQEVIDRPVFRDKLEKFSAESKDP